MSMQCIEYKGGYKYQLYKTYQLNVSIEPSSDITTNYIDLDQVGNLTLKKGYAWDGPSGPTIDTLNFMRGSLVHDALYQLMRAEQLSAEQHREAADDELKCICLEDGMSSIRAWWVYKSVRWFGEGATDGEAKKKVLGAPSQDCVQDEI